MNICHQCTMTRACRECKQQLKAKTAPSRPSTNEILCRARKQEEIHRFLPWNKDIGDRPPLLPKPKRVIYFGEEDGSVVNSTQENTQLCRQEGAKKVKQFFAKLKKELQVIPPKRKGQAHNDVAIIKRIKQLPPPPQQKCRPPPADYLFTQSLFAADSDEKDCQNGRGTTH